jgi:hypothetical protein
MPWLVERAGVTAKLGFKAHPHMLRHACGFALANKGHDTRALQAYLGHKNIQHTVRYTECRPVGSRTSGDDGSWVMISLKQCQAYLNECEALGAEAKLTLRRATAVMAVCHAWLALSDAVREYETIVGEEAQGIVR